MADGPNREATQRQHLEWLLEGVEAWNTRRNRELFSPDLAKVDVASAFREANKLSSNARIPLQEINFRRADLTDTNLGAADLTKADLRGAILNEVNLRRADLSHADLIGAELKAANLQNTILKDADLEGSDLREANLRRTNLEGANLNGANLSSGSNPNDKDEINYTDVSTTLLLTQTQLDGMLGDSSTVIPEHLTRPAQWPDLEQSEDSPPDPTATAPAVPFVFLSYAYQDHDQIGALNAFLSEQTLNLW